MLRGTKGYSAVPLEEGFELLALGPTTPKVMTTLVVEVAELIVVVVIVALLVVSSISRSVCFTTSAVASPTLGIVTTSASGPVRQAVLVVCTCFLILVICCCDLVTGS